LDQEELKKLNKELTKLRDISTAESKKITKLLQNISAFNVYCKKDQYANYKTQCDELCKEISTSLQELKELNIEVSRSGEPGGPAIPFTEAPPSCPKKTDTGGKRKTVKNKKTNSKTLKRKTK
jgi:hypothetical protein